jgi:dTMP kinase
VAASDAAERPVSRGVLVVLEGGEGVGKTTQWERLAAHLAGTGRDVLALREPGGTPPGDRIRELLLTPDDTLAPETEALLFAASRAELLTRAVRPALARGALVLLDRYLLSTYVYQGAGRGMDGGALRAINRFATGGLVPDLTLLLTLPLAEARHRARARLLPDRLEREAEVFHARVAEGFALASTPAWQAEHPECGPIVPIDALGTRDAVAARCIEALHRRWPEQFGPSAGIIEQSA